jgi:hypothetical protein
MPMNKGDWNIKGVNMPTFSPALPPMPGSDWRTFPQPIDGRQLSAARPQFSAFAGIGQGYGAVDYATAKAAQFRDVQGSGGYGYRQFKDGAIQILVSPSRALPVGSMLTGSTGDPNYARWFAITNEIGAWKTFAQARAAQTLRTLTDTATALSSSVANVAGAVKAGKRKRRKAAAAQAAFPAETPAAAEPAPVEAPGFLSGPLPWIIGGSVAVLLIVLATRGSSTASK